MIAPSRHRLLPAALAVAGLALAAIPVPASAQFGLGGIVYDPTNYAQNVLTAARSLQQINNQIRQIQNQAQSLINEARNLASLPVSTLSTLTNQINQTRQLLTEAQRIAYRVRDIQQAFTQRYNGANLTASSSQMVANANARWQDSIGAYQDALEVQAGVVGNLDGARASIETLVTASQSATGALQASQAGNQLLALQSQQLADLSAAVAAQGRAQALEAARNAAEEAEARERLRRFFKR
ncbi:P-type conjugative transfer protein TrbJ [Sphingomonas sp. MMSM20]|uniref:P-type conjugative transfer protein TrbJ n=1 Tax=Sphingomonas lycopersici TaxID=2951807 RepID=UPI002237DF22|nr:P-type conjugative transfer protein TrbJ [Sphingomonas lycopersici]MCW6530731.1 P-type conjugative transfer protein TrbJ [Sphingomonas lycopersici]